VKSVRANLTILVLTVVLAVVYLYGTTQIPSLEIGDPLGPRAFPNLLGIGMLIAAAMFALEIWRDKVKKVEQDKVDLQPKVVGVLLGVVVWTSLYYLFFVSAGYVLATSVYLLPLMAYFHPRKWVANIASTLLFSLLTYWLFVKLDVNLPKGLLPF
jgi:putative tricarboxylic transport membrane protein